MFCQQKVNILQNDVDETELRDFFCRHYYPFSLYSMPLFPRMLERESNGNGDKKNTLYNIFKNFMFFFFLNIQTGFTRKAGEVSMIGQ